MSRGHREPSDRWSTLAADFTPGRLPATLLTGVVLAMVNSLLVIALTSLIFRGELDEALSLGIGFSLVGSAVLAFVIALGSSFPGIYAGVQDASAAILGLSAASIATSVVGPEAVDTVLAMITVTSLATGLVFLLMGYFGLGEIARFVPFPVIGGLLAGTGYLILAGSIGILGVGSVADLMAGDSLGTFLPGVALAASFFIASRRRMASRIYLGFLAGGVIGFHVVTRFAGVDQATSLARGWLLGPLPEGGLWPGLVTDALAGADWEAIAGETVSLVTILLIVPITVLLYISALEIETKLDLDMGVELRATGWANVAAVAVGGPPGYLYLADTLITQRLVGRRRGPAVVAAFALLAVVMLGGSILELLPQFVIGGLLLFVGVDFLVEWLWTSRRRMTRLDYALMVGIVAIIATVGFLPGVAVGLVAAIALFVVRYSRIDVVKHSLTAREHQSNIERARTDADYLQDVGDCVLILELQGFIFFGTASKVIRHVRSHLETTESLRFVICDFRLVTGLDSSAVNLFERIALLARDRGLMLTFTGLRASQRGQFSELISDYSDVVRVEPDLDHGMAWCEDHILENAGPRSGPDRPLPEGLAEALAPYLTARTIPPGDQLMRQGDPSPGIFLIMSGRATVLLEGEDREQVRLRTLLGGTVLGEISLYRNEPCTATVVADTECQVLHITPESFDVLCRTDPAAAADFHAFVVRTLAGRVSHANRAIRALQA
ncbi:MAG TPA: cyclic nucleotide-binding domain-containing protein [Acidimicrobiia bacterium]|nr:cyclic nucleotide-binding domain-containing protein [Acidimicrobiia bacterium]